MKPTAVAACLLFATSLLQAQTAPAAKAPDAPAPATPAAAVTKDGKPAPKAAPGAAKAAPAVKKEAPLPPIPGTVINRPNGTFLSLEVVDGNFKLSFYDKKHKLMAVDVTRATARWPNMKSATPGQFRTVLNGSGTALVGQHPVFPPYTFNVFLTLLQGEGDEAKAVENYTVAFKG
jgi:hypothetical protein